MKAKNFILLAFFIYATYSQGQVWEHTYGIPNHYETAEGVTSSYDNGYLMGINRDSKAALLLKASINGDMLWLKTFKDVNDKTFVIQSLSNPSADAIYFTGGLYYTGANAFLASIDNCGNIKWCKKEVFNDQNYGKFIKTTINQNIQLVTYGASPSPLIDRYQILEIDPDGNIIWMKQLLPGTQTYFQSTEFHQMCLTSDGGSLMAGYTYCPQDTLNPYWSTLQPCAIKCDNHGDMQWVYPPYNGADTNRVGFFAGCTQINDIFYAVGCDYGHADTTLIPTVVRFDANGLLKSYNLMLPDTMNDLLTNIIPATDTSLLIISSTNQFWDNPNHLAVYITDTLGNYRNGFYRYDLVVGQFGDEVAKMKNNKFVIPCQSHIGWPGPLTDVVAIKLNANLEYDSVYTQAFTYDSLCPYPIVSDTIICNCEPFVSVKEAEKSLGKITISPNPAKEWFTVGFPRSLQQAGKVSIYDMLGRVQYSEVLTPGQKQTKINCEGWKSGLYFVKCQSGGKVLSGKVVIF